MSNIEKTLLSVLRQGEKNAVTSKKLRALTGLSERNLRKIMEGLRRKGCVIISCNAGYYIPANSDELKKYIDRESHRARSVFYTLKSARTLLKNMDGENNGKG